MSIATRLVFALVLTIGLVMLPYGAITQRQRERVLGRSHVTQTAVMARLLQDAVGDAARSGRTANASQVLSHAAANPDILAAAVLDPNGAVVAGAPGELPACLRTVVRPPARRVPPASGWARCEGRVSWAVTPMGRGRSLLLARVATALESEFMASRLRHLALAVVLITAATAALAAVLRQSLGVPLERVAAGIRALEEGRPVRPVEIPRAALEIIGLAGAFNKMTARLEERRQHMVREADERVELERRIRDGEKLAVLGRLSAGLSHELGSPLNVIAFRAEAILADRAASPGTREHAAEVLAEVERIAGLVRGLLHAGRRGGIQRLPVDVAELARRVAGELADRAAATGVELRLHAPRPAVLAGDGVLLRHAVLNLARNAVDALVAHPGERWVELSVATRGDGVEVAVEDSGPGIPATARAQLFEPFFTTKGPGQGTGMGLAVSRGIVEEHGGELVLEDRPGGGVRAVARLPAGDGAGAGVRA